MFEMTQQRFERLLRYLCIRSTSADEDGWTSENPLWGHCAVVALLVQDEWGGEILRASLEGVPEFAQMRSHYSNRLPDGRNVDLSRSQFGDRYPTLTWAPRARTEILDPIKYPETVRRYKHLRTQLDRVKETIKEYYGM
jgi:hypothetical protein